VNKLKNAFFSVLNILVIAGILLFIMAGLMKIGIFEVPDFLKGLFGIEAADDSDDSSDNTDFLKQSDEDTEYEIYSAELTPDNVKKILSELEVAEKYAHDVLFTVHSESGSMSKRVFVMKQNEKHCAFFLSGDGGVEKQIVSDGSTTSVNTAVSDKLKSVSYPNGYVDFAEQTGVILTHEDFFEAADQDGYSFEIKSDDNGAVMIIRFISEMGEYKQNQVYTLNLDYGIVTEAECYENGILIYELATNSLSDSITPNFVIPEPLKKQLPEEFSEVISES